MVLYGIWLIDANSGLLLSHITIPGFTFNPDLFSGFIAATHDFAKETSGGKLNSIAMGNFKLLVRRDRVLMKVIAVGARDPEARYEPFIQNLEAQVDPQLATLHREPDGFKAVTSQFRKHLLEIIIAELEQFNARKAPSDLSELTILHEKSSQTLLEALLQQPQTALTPELATTKTGLAYPLASALTGLDEEKTLQLLARLEEFGILLSEPMDTALACLKCQSLHLHPHLLCPNCQTPALPVRLFEHLTCGHIGIKYSEVQELQCHQCGTQDVNPSEFRLFRGYQCSQCNASFSNPQMVFTCHSCHTIIEPEEAEVTVLNKYVLNPTFTSELEIFFEQQPTQINPSQILNAQHQHPQPRSPLPKPQSLPETPYTKSPHPPSLAEPTPLIQKSHDSGKEIVSNDETQLLKELRSLERALKDGTITEAEYDRQFIRLRLQLRQLRTQPTL
ncbi:MAG: hypothetical protein ACFE8F_04085 [Promethearchaeota archaeon]